MSDELTEPGDVDTDGRQPGDVDTDGRQPGDDATTARGERRPTPGSTPRPSPGAAAASRARRIGGATRRPVHPTPPDAASSTVSMTKPAGERSEKAPRAPAQVSPPTPVPAAPQPLAPAAASAPPRWLRWLPALVLTAAAVAMAAFFAIESHGVWWARPSANAVRDEVLAAAKTCVVAANSYSYQDFAAAEQKGAACTTGRQTEIYRNAMANIKPKAIKLKAAQVAQVNAAGVAQVSPDGKQWTVLVFGQLTVHATQTGPKGRIDPFGAVVRMDHVGGKWLLSSIDPVSSPTG